jgi:putative exosortase-associated protein (TIGR04073 family)
MPLASRVRPCSCPTRATIALMALLVLSAHAVLLPASAAAVEHSAARKLGRGLAGITTGFLEIPGNVLEESRENGVLPGLTVGLSIGLGKFVARELLGVYEVVTSPFEAPPGYVPILSPEFPWDYFEPGTGTTFDSLEREIAQIPGVSLERREDWLRLRFPGDLLFATGSAALNPSAMSPLQAVAAALVRHENTTIAINGYTDSTGDPAANVRLSLDRASRVRDHLIGEGVAADRMTVEGHGAASPVATNATAAGRRQNRRVEIELRRGYVTTLQ